MHDMILVVEPNIQQFQHYHTGKLIFSECKSAIKHFITAVFLNNNYAVLCKHMQVYVFLFTFAATKRLYKVHFKLVKRGHECSGITRNTHD